MAGISSQVLLILTSLSMETIHAMEGPSIRPGPAPSSSPPVSSPDSSTSSECVTDDNPWPPFNVEMRDYRDTFIGRTGMRYLKGIKEGNDPCAPFHVDNPMLEDWEREESAKCTMAITAFQILPTEAQGPCENLSRVTDESITAIECMYGNGRNPGFCPVKIPVRRAGLVSWLCPWRQEWIPLEMCTRHLVFHPEP